jgi:hypothetical protein
MTRGLAAVAVVVAATPAFASDEQAEFKLLEDYTGEKFFQKFDFFDAHDPTDGAGAARSNTALLLVDGVLTSSSDTR